MELKKIQVNSGEYKGRYVGQPFSGKGLITNPDIHAKPPVNVSGTNYGLWAQEMGATQYFEPNIAAVQAELRAAGIESEVVD